MAVQTRRRMRNGFLLEIGSDSRLQTSNSIIVSIRSDELATLRGGRNRGIHLHRQLR